MRDWAVRPVWAGCYSWAALSLIDFKTLYIQITFPAKEWALGCVIPLPGRGGELTQPRAQFFCVVYFPANQIGTLTSGETRKQLTSNQEGGVRREEQRGDEGILFLGPRAINVRNASHLWTERKDKLNWIEMKCDDRSLIRHLN